VLGKRGVKPFKKPKNKEKVPTNAAKQLNFRKN
jgi:hypothetical protein